MADQGFEDPSHALRMYVWEFFKVAPKLRWVFVKETSYPPTKIELKHRKSL